MTNFEERRTDRRYRVSFRVHWGRDESPEYEGEVTDLGAGGCFVESEGEVGEGDIVKMRLDIPGRGELTLWGNVAYWIRDTGFGLRFSAYFQGGAREKLETILIEESRQST